MIFNPFEKAATERTTDGFGLGLSIVKGLVQLLNGEISVESQQGKGSIFYLTLPLALLTDEKTQEVEQRETILSPNSLPRFILVIDDNLMQLTLYQEMMERNGIRCDVCSHVRDLVRMMRKQNYDLLLTDIQMPGTNGFELLELLRNSQIGNSRTIPVMAMTAQGESDQKSLIEAGFSGSIYKPFSFQEFLQALCQFYSCEKENDIDFSLLTQGVKDKRKMLEQFILETKKNIEELEKVSKSGDIVALRQTVHRMFPLWELLHKENILIDLQDALRKTPSDEMFIANETNRIITFCKQLIQDANQELYKHEEDTDC